MSYAFSLKSCCQPAKPQLFNDSAPKQPTFIVQFKWFTLWSGHLSPFPYLPLSVLLPALLIHPLCISFTRRRKAVSPREMERGGWRRKWGGCRQSLATEKRDEESEIGGGKRRVKWNFQHIKHTLLPSACTCRVKRGVGLLSDRGPMKVFYS